MNLIVGASGTLGKIVARRLLAQGEAVRALLRTPEKVADLQRLGAQVVQGDLRDPVSLRCACAGATTVIAAAHSLFGRGAARSAVVDDQGHRALIEVAKAAGVQHFVYLSVHFYEILPHVNKCEPSFLEQVRRYSERVGHDVVGLADGSAVLHTSQTDYQCVGEVQRFRKGVVSPIEPMRIRAAIGLRQVCHHQELQPP